MFAIPLMCIYRTLSNISPLPSLKFLNVARNRIKDVVEVEKLIDLSSLRYLLFYGNPASSVASYRVHVLHYLRHLAELDAKSPTNDELAEAELIRLRRQIKQQQSLPTVNAPALSSDSKAKKKKVAVQVLNLGVDQNHHPLSLSLSSVSKTPAGSSKSTVPSTSLRRRRPFS